MSTLASPALELLAEIESWAILDPHTHLDPLRPAARHFDEILGYHYYTEQAHSAGMPAADASPELDPDERCRRVARYLDRIENTTAYSWLSRIAREFHGLEAERIGPAEVEALISRGGHADDGTSWDESVWRRSKLECVFLTNDFDDPLVGFDTRRFVPCLRTDELVFKLDRPGVVERLSQSSAVDVQDAGSLLQALGATFERFVARGSKACAISLPPDFVPRRSTPVVAGAPLRRALRGLDLREDERALVQNHVFWTIAELASEFRLPFDLMIGSIREIYPAGVAGGRDLLDRRVSLADYGELFRHFGSVTFPVSTLSPDASEELVAYSWIFPNVLPMGHWWYSNLPAYIGNHLRARLQGVPRTKLLGYYSDAYKLEFVLPKFGMYREVLAEVLAEELVSRRAWSMTQAVDLARSILVENPRRVFGLAAGADLTS
jgi:glucuronate isomerase